MTVDFKDYFWGDKNNGYDVLYHNMKYGLVASKELSEFFRERTNIEENYSKLLNKLAKQASNCCVNGTFAPFWQLLKSTSERLSSLHMQMVYKVTELVKDVNKYTDDLHKKHKNVKEDESGTLEAVQAIQSATLMVQKAKDLYTQKGFEVEKLRKESGSPKDVEKAEIKFKKAQDDYKTFIEKYSTIKEDFERKMSITCLHFQEIEETHLLQMKEFLQTYAEVVQTNHDLIGQIQSEFKRKCMEMTVDKLLETFVLSKCTGLEKPGIIDDDLNVNNVVQKVQVDVDKDQTNTTNNTNANDGSANSVTQQVKLPKREVSILGFLKSRREKLKRNKMKKKDNVDNISNKEEKSDLEEKDDSNKVTPVAEVESNAPVEIDAEGFCIRPKSTPQISASDKNSFYSSSDSDSDDEREQKLHVEIKPLNNGTAPISASVDELRATVENLSLSPIAALLDRRCSTSDNQDINMKRSQSVSQQLGGKVSGELLRLNLQSPVASNASTPTVLHPYAPLRSPSVLQSPSQPTTNSPTFSSQKYADLGDIFSEIGEIQTSTLKSTRQIPTPTSGYMSIPRPPSRRSEGPSPRGRVSPSTISRADSVGSLEFRTACVSRGPSPLTIGMADAIPLAVAFHEIVHSYFRGSDESKCQVKMSGDMMLSFPAGIVTVLANNPNPAKLIFKVKNIQRLNSILPNKQLVTIDTFQSETDNLVLEFNISALSSLLKRQWEQNPSASYFNVDILKYQIKPKLGANSCPFQLVAYWKCEESHTDLKIDYKYNSHAMSSPSPLLNVTVTVPINGGVRSMKSNPVAQWVSENNRIIWKFTELSQHTENYGIGSIRARLDLESGPSTPSVVSMQFNCEGTTLSGIDFQLIGSGYRLSLVKRRFVSGKYICDGEADSKHKYVSTDGDDC